MLCNYIAAAAVQESRSVSSLCQWDRQIWFPIFGVNIFFFRPECMCLFQDKKANVNLWKEYNRSSSNVLSQAAFLNRIEDQAFLDVSSSSLTFYGMKRPKHAANTRLQHQIYVENECKICVEHPNVVLSYLRHFSWDLKWENKENREPNFSRSVASNFYYSHCWN